jgi:hypothetical protein
MSTLIATVLFLIFLFLSAIHFYWGLGGRWGSGAVIPTKDDNVKVMNPRLAESFIVAFGLLSFGLLILIKAGIIAFSLPAWLSVYGLWIIAGIFIVRAIGEFRYVGLFKKIRHTKFGQMDTKFYSPLCLFVGILTIILELNK